MVIDAHAHLGNSNNQNWTAEKLIDSMREAAIDYSLVITDRQSDYSKMDSVIKLAAKHPQIKVIGDVSLTEFNSQELDLICDYLKKGLIRGVKFYPGYEDFYPSDKIFNSIYTYCEMNNIPVVFHTGVLESGYKGLLKQSHPLNIDEVANNFPDLKIVMAHIGNPWIMDCGAVLSKNKNVYADISGYFTEDTRISENEIKFFGKQMIDLRDFVGGFDKLLFGTDYPLYNQKEYLQAVQLLPLTDREKELVFWKNANLVYNLGL